MFEWHKAEISDVALEFGTDIKVGRTNIDPKRKRNANNTVYRVAPVDSGKIIRRVASDASLILLAVTYIIAALLGYHVEALIAIPLMLAAFTASCYIRYFAEKQIYGSRVMLLPKAKVIESGKRLRVGASEIEIGDLIYFGKGDIIPADARLVSSENLEVLERFYHKQSDKAEYKRFKKNHETIYIENNPAGIYDNMVYAASTVISGRGAAIVTDIGSATRIGKTDGKISLSSENDNTDYLNSFSRFTKRFSLAVLLSLIPFSLIQIYLMTLNNSDGEQSSILYIFLVMLAIAVTSMSELISASASAIVSHTLYGRRGKIDTGVTRLSSTDKIADADTLLILCPEVFVDKRIMVRRVFHTDKEYRFDSLKSVELDSFSSSIARYLSDRRNNVDPFERKALKRFVSTVNRSEKSNDLNSDPIFIKVDDINTLNGCEFFRTEGGSLWRFADDSRQRVVDYYYKYLDLGLKVSLYISMDNEQPIFEGMVAIGEEYPFSDGKTVAACLENGVTPVLILENENDDAVNFALNCGMVDSINDIVFASTLAEAGKLLSDLPTNTPVYIGFGRDATKDIVKNLTQHGRKVLPIIKDLSNKSAILPLTVYATHCESSYESVITNSSLSLGSPDAEKHCGGIADALRNIQNSRLARLKTGIFKRYLTFATVFRLTIAAVALLANSSVRPMPALMILLSGLITDGAALLSFTASTGIPTKEQKYSPPILCALAGIFIALASHLTTNILLDTGCISFSNSQTFVFYSSVMTQMIALGAFILVLKNRTSGFKFNLAYVAVVSAYSVYLVAQNWFSDTLFTRLNSLSYSRVDIRTLPFLLICGALSFALIIVIDKIFVRKN